MRNLIVRTSLSALLCLLQWLSSVLLAQAAETDIANIPMAVSNNAPPNFMFMLDNSGSMSNIVPPSDYSEASPSSLGGNCADAKKIPTSDPVYLRVVSGAPKVQLDLSVGPKGSTTSCTSGCAVGTSTATNPVEVCFDESTDQNGKYVVYTNVRLLATQGCGAGCTTAKGATYLPASYSGKFLNWYFRNGVTTGWTDRKPGSQTRLEIAKSAAKAALDTIPLPTGGRTAKLRAGLTTYNGDDGGLLLRAVQDLDATHLANLKTSIDGLTATGSTPLSETLADIGQYFSLGNSANLTTHPGSASAASVTPAQLFKQGATAPHRLNQGPVSCAGFSCPIQYWCQRSYAILMTDGRPQSDQALSTNNYLCDYDGDSGNCSTNGGRAYDQKTGARASDHPGHIGGTHSYESAGSDYLNDVAQALREIDLRPDLVPTGRTKTTPSNVRTYTVGFADEQAKNDPLLQETAAQGGGVFLTADGPASLKKAFVDALSHALESNSAAAAVAVTSSQITSDSVAYVSSYKSDYWIGDLQAFSIDTASGLPIKELWSAQAKLQALAAPQSDRKIVSYNGRGGSAFTSGNYADGSIGLTAGVIDYLRGNGSGDGSTYRHRDRLFGDVINAEPVLVDYGDSKVVFQGANDGMLHAIDGSRDGAGGTELWAYVPAMLLPRLADLASPAYSHEYFVDATPAVGDVSNPGFTEKILVGGLGKGGRGYYALKITSGTAASESDAADKVLWETVPSATNSGFSFGTPLIVKTPNDGWLVLVTSGYNNGTSTGGDGQGRLWALDPRNGRVVREIVTSGGAPATPAGLTHVSRMSNTADDATTSYVYGGDLLGNVWRFDLSTWEAVKIAELTDGSGAAQPITSAPVVRQVSGSTDKFWVDVGTGQYLGNSDVPNDPSENSHARQTQSMYGIIDDTTVGSPTRPSIRGTNGNSCPAEGGDGQFVCQRVVASTSTSFTLSTNLLQAKHRGWYFDIPISLGRVNTHPAVTTSGVLVFTVNVPSSVICDPGGSSWFMAVDGDSGGAVRRSTTGGATFESGWFIDNALASRVVIVQTATDKRALIRMSDQQNKNPLIPETGAVPSKWRRVYWRELM